MMGLISLVDEIKLMLMCSCPCLELYCRSVGGISGDCYLILPMNLNPTKATSTNEN